DLVERFLDRFLPLANQVVSEGAVPVMPALEPGGNYWDTAFLYIDDAQPITYSLSGTDLDCFGNHSGEIDVSASGGFPPYTYHVTNPGGQISEYTSNPITGLDAGQYVVYVYDSYGCKAEALVIGGLFNAGTTFLPDGSGAMYTSSLNISGFNAGQTLQSLSQLQNICLNMEHSYMGDLTMTLITPGGQSLLLKSGYVGGSTDLGEPIATGAIDGSASSTLIDPGVGYDYCFNANPMYGTMGSMANTFQRNYTDGQGHNYTDYYLPGGSYTPEGNWSSLLGSPLNGTWTIQVIDNMYLDNGYIFNWSISFVSDLPDTVVILDQPNPIDIGQYITNATCGASNGAINISVNGNYPPFTYLWNTGATTEDISALAAGAYSITVSDIHGCSDSANYAVSNTSSLALTSVINPVTCSGTNTGSINISVTGGTTPYSFLWSNAATTEDVSNLTSGSYTVTITDAGGCQLVRVFNVAAVTPVTISLLNQQNEMCSTGNGVLSVSASGGSGSFGYHWNNGATTASLTNLHTGTYSLTVTDANGCTATHSWFISNDVSNCAAYCYLNVTDNSIVDDNCGHATGSIDISVNSATQPWILQWSNGATTEDISGLTQGSYTVTVTDANQCVTTHSCVVFNNTGNLTVTSNSIQNETCGSGNGSINISGNGGALPYSFLWSNSATTEDVSNLHAGNYIVSLTDANGCMVSQNYSITNDAGNLQVTGTIANETCGAGNGAITQNVTGGFGTKTYNWSNGSHLQSISGIHAGSYACTITDAGGCSTIRSYVVNNLSGAVSVVVTSVANENCGNGTGNIDITATGTGLTYNWSNGLHTEDIGSLHAGTYSCTISNSTGCTAVTGNIYVFDTPGTIAVATTSSGNEVCGNGLGFINVTPSGGTAPLTFLWSNGSTSEDIYSLHAGNYTLTVTDANGCEYIYSKIISNLQGTLSLQNSQVTNETCGNANGAINIVLAGGTAPLTYHWSNSASTEDISGLSAGLYSITVTDANGCVLNHSENIQNIAGTLSATYQVTNEICSNSAGAVNISVSGGTTPYTFAWSNSATSEDISSLHAGIYSCTVTDNTGCHIVVGSAVVGNSSAGMSASAVVTNETCGNANGAVNLTVLGGSGAIDYVWSNAATTEDILGLIAGNYSYTATDANGCLVSGSAIVVATSGNLSSSYIVTDETCNSNTGAIDLTVSGGVSPYTFLWSNAQSSEDLTGLSAGNFICTVTDANGCEHVTSTISVADNPGSLAITTLAVTNSICNQNNGRINLTVIGGSTPYTFAWSNSATTEDMVGLSAGLYIVTVTDASGCSAVGQSIVQNDNGSFGISDAVITDEHCSDQTGAVNITVSGGTIPYTYSWSNGATSQDISALGAGSYMVFVSDNAGCTDNGSYQVVNQGADLTITQASVTNALCTAHTGSITIAYTGGVGPYSFSWSNGSHTQDANNLVAGNYSLTITDASGCSVNGSWTVGMQPGTMSLLGTSSNEYCGNGMGAVNITATGGATPYSYAWNSGAITEDIVGVHAGNYVVTVTDFYGCKINYSTVVNNITSGITATLDSLHNENCSQSDGEIFVSISGGTPPYNIVWSNGATTEDIASLQAGSYSITVTDATTCSYTLNANVQNITGGMSVSFVNIQDEICGNGDGFIDIEVAGGSGPYSYLWSDGSFSQDLVLLHHGSYTVTVTDQTGCDMIQNFTVNSNNGSNISGSGITENAICTLLSGSIDLTVSGGIQPLTYIWNTGATSQDLSNLAAGTYIVTISDVVGCSDTSTFVLVQETNPNLAFSYLYSFSDYCYENTGEIMWDGLGSVNLSYFFDGTEYIIPDVNNLAPGWYEVSIVDENGCAIDSMVQIDNDSYLTINANVTNEHCGHSDGAIDIDAIGSGSLVYWWSNGVTTEDLINIPAGTYTCTVSDGSCADDITVVVGNTADFTASMATTNAYCGDSSGSIVLTTQPSGSGFSYLWSNGATTQNLSNLPTGIYYCTVSNSQTGCDVVLSDTVWSITSGLAVNSIVISDSCSLGYGACSNVVYGGSGVYSYQWGHGPTTADLTNLQGGSYTFTSIDMSDGCSTTAFIYIPDVRTFHASALVTDASCSYCNDGMIDVSVSNATGYNNTYTYLWSFGAVTQDGVSLAPGTYSVTITSNLGCDTVMTFNIDFPTAIGNSNKSSNIQLAISPNPANDQSQILWYLPNGKSGEIQIANTEGVILKKWHVSNEGCRRLEAKVWAPGSYSVSLRTEDELITRQLIIVR
ncbi:MAG: hypothetical protein CVU11_15960, partial [Bacteroidetes bacterium HGW-Bacteroidetes-6]